MQPNASTSRKMSRLAVFSGLAALAVLAREAHAKGLVGKLPGNPASCQEEPCNSDPQHVLAALKVMCMFLGVVLILPLLLYYLSKMFTKIRGVCCGEQTEDGEGGGGGKQQQQQQQQRHKTKQELRAEEEAEADGDVNSLKQQQQWRQGQGQRASNNSNNNLCGSISALVSSAEGKAGADFQLARAPHSQSPSPPRPLSNTSGTAAAAAANHFVKSSDERGNQNVQGGHGSDQFGSLGESQLQQMAAHGATRHQSLQYNNGRQLQSPDNSASARGLARDQQQRQSQRARQQRNSIARLQGGVSESVRASKRTPPPLRERNDCSAEADEDEQQQQQQQQRREELAAAAAEAAMVQKYNLRPHRYSMFFAAGGGAGADNCAVGVATPAAVIQNPQQAGCNLQVTMDQMDQLRRKSLRNASSSSQRVTSNPMSSSIRRKRPSSYKIHPAQEPMGPAATELLGGGGGGGTNKQQLLARANAIDDQQPQQQQSKHEREPHYCSPALSRQLLVASGASDQNNNNNTGDGAGHHRAHERLRARQSSPYAGGGGGETKANRRVAQGEAQGNLEVPLARPEHRHSIDGSILNNMLAGAGGPLEAGRPRFLTAGRDHDHRQQTTTGNNDDDETATTTTMGHSMAARQQQQQVSHNNHTLRGVPPPPPPPISLRSERRLEQWANELDSGALAQATIDYRAENTDQRRQGHHLHNNYRHQQQEQFQDDDERRPSSGGHYQQQQQPAGASGQLQPGGVDARVRRASLNAAALMRAADFR